MRYYKQCLTILTSLAVLFFYTACSDNDGEKKKGKIDEFTEKTGKKMVDYIKIPLDKAQDATEKANQRNDGLKEFEAERDGK